MPSTIHILVDDTFFVDEVADSIRIFATAQLVDNSNRIDIHFQFIDSKGVRLCDASYSATATNPIELGAIAVAAATGFGICSAGRFLWSSWRIVKETYDAAEGSKPSERAYHTINALPGKNKQFLEAAKNTGKYCGKFAVEALLGKVAGL